MLFLIKSVKIQNWTVEFNNWLMNVSYNFDFPVFQKQMKTYMEITYFI